LKVKTIKLGFLDTNCYVVDGNDYVFVIDPGSGFKNIIDFLKKENLSPDFIIVTHCHFDHIGAVPELSEYFKIPVYIHEKEEEILKDPGKNLSSFFNSKGLLLKTYKTIKGEEVKNFLSNNIDVVNVPGHTPGSILIKYLDFLFTGDLLFKGSIGRTDLPGGDPEQMKNSLAYLKSIKENYVVFPGHGSETTLEEEIKNNFFLK